MIANRLKRSIAAITAILMLSGQLAAAVPGKCVCADELTVAEVQSCCEQSTVSKSCCAAEDSERCCCGDGFNNSTCASVCSCATNQQDEPASNHKGNQGPRCDLDVSAFPCWKTSLFLSNMANELAHNSSIANCEIPTRILHCVWLL